MSRYRGLRQFASKTPIALSEPSETRVRPTRHLPPSTALQHMTLLLHPDPAPSVRQKPPTEDVCAFLFGRCQEWQRAFLDDAGLTCMFDVDSGKLPTATCDTLAAIAHQRLHRLAGAVEPPGGTVTVTLRHRPPMWALALSDAHLRVSGPRLTRHEMAVLKTHVGQLGGAYMIQPTDEGTLLAILFSDTPGVLSADVLAESRAEFTQ